MRSTKTTIQVGSWKISEDLTDLDRQVLRQEIELTMKLIKRDARFRRTS